MNSWSEKYIKSLQQSGKIRGAQLEKRKHHAKSRGPSIPPQKSKALTWLEWNLTWWANQHAVTLEREYKFHPGRGWRFDFAIPSLMIALEYEGGIFMQKSGHTNVAGMTRDAEKYNTATAMGWRVIRATATHYKEILSQLNELIKT